MAGKRYDNGDSSYIEVLDAERSLFSAQSAYEQTRANVYTSRVDVYKAMGGGWMDEAEDMAFLPE